ncbi:PREDICTED: uncharacterized protein LOC104763085 [Camelina sativa]|uniref:Uncharacterized protein LOC104763085 n=1 Tax=Camelina sativa TaxID=90675 RepID=A0ABM0XEM4_CAMSA|nr:PREDICTED: uncharacterized protein LOC104763085 [Camelina sativa]
MIEKVEMMGTTTERLRKRSRNESPAKYDGKDDQEDARDVENKKKRKRSKQEGEDDVMERFEYEVEEAVADWFDEFQIRRNTIPDSSDEDEDPVITRDRKIRLGTNDKLAIGRTFFTGFEFKETVLHYALKNRENLRQDRWEKDKISFRCAIKKGCGWYVYCAYEELKQMWVLKTICTDHSCTSNGKCKLLKSPVIGRLFMDKLRLKPNFMPLKIQRHIKEQWKICSTIGQVQRGRLLALKWLKEEYDKQFSHIRGYVAEIIDSNKGSTAFVDTISNAAGEDVFNRIYVCLGAMKNAFYYCRPIIGIDGTFLKHAVKGCLLTAIGHDANNQIYPVAWACVQAETADNWLWFLNQLSVDLNLKDGSDYVVLSDRCKGIISAVKSALLKAEHNPWSYNHFAYEVTLDELRAYSMSLYEDVMKEEPNTWCRPFFKIDSCCEDVDNNATESFNATIVKARAKALVPMMEIIRRQAMARITKRKKKILKWKKKISEYVLDILEKEEEEAMKCEVTKGTHQKFEVWIDGNSQGVCLSTWKWECSCCNWQVTGIPCEHAYAEIIVVGKNVEDFVSPCFSSLVWLEQYDTGPNPVRGQRFWMTNKYVLVKAPPEPIPPGRNKGQNKKYDRIKGKLESPKKKKKKGEPEILKLGRKERIMHCKSCGEAGHNAAGCVKFPKEKNSKKSKKHDTIQPAEACF